MFAYFINHKFSSFQTKYNNSKFCHSKPHTTHQFEKKKTIMWVQAFLSRKYLVFCLTLQGLWTPVFLPCCTTGRPVVNSTIGRMQKIYSGTYKLNTFYNRKNVFHSPPLPPIYFQPQSQFWHIFDASTYFKLLSTSPI